MKWQEFFKDEEKEDWKPEIFPKQKSNLPPKNTKNLTTFLNGVKSELTGSSMNKTTRNIPKGEVKAIEELIKIQKDCVLMIKPCDKGAGIIICDFEKYVESCEDHLKSVDSEENTYYEKIPKEVLEKSKKDIEKTLKTALNMEQITKHEFEEMMPKEKGPGKMYQLFKVHKTHNPPKLPPGRPVISGCGSITENISKFIEHHAKSLVPEIPSYLQDTPDLLRQLEDFKLKDLPIGSFPVSIDVVGLYTNIPHGEGIEVFKQKLETRKDKTVPTEFLVNLLTHVLKSNIFEFKNDLFLQKIGTAY
jgi:hypothetical protein